MLIAAREFFAQELKSPQPRLEDRWFPTSCVFGLSSGVERWFRRRTGPSRPPSPSRTVGPRPPAARRLRPRAAGRAAEAPSAEREASASVGGGRGHACGGSLRSVVGAVPAEAGRRGRRAPGRRRRRLVSRRAFFRKSRSRMRRRAPGACLALARVSRERGRASNSARASSRRPSFARRSPRTARQEVVARERRLRGQRVDELEARRRTERHRDRHRAIQAPRRGTARPGRARRRAPRCAPSPSPPRYARARDRRRSRPGARTGRARRRAPRPARARRGRGG